MNLSTPDPAARRPLKSRDVRAFQILAEWLARRGVSPNGISFASILFGCAAGAAMAVTAHTPREWAQTGWWLVAAVCIQLRLMANLLDGMVAVEGQRGGPTGDLWNEAPDRISDAATLIGAGFAAGSAPLLGFGAALVAVFVAYVRALGASVGAGQIFLGPQAKPQRMAVMTVVCAISAVCPMIAGNSRADAYPNPLIVVGLLIVTFGGVLTAWRRLTRIAAFLRERNS